MRFPFFAQGGEIGAQQPHNIAASLPHVRPNVPAREQSSTGIGPSRMGELKCGCDSSGRCSCEVVIKF